MRFALLVMVLLAGSARADSKQPFGITLGTDGHVSANAGLVQEDVSPRVEITPAPHHTLVVRGGVGQALLERETDTRHVAAGYRLQLDHAYFGGEVGYEWFRGDQQMQGYTWFAKNVVTVVVGAKVGPVDVGVDVEPRGRIGVHVGVDLVRFSL